MIFYFIVFVFVLGTLILVHEWGHFIAARKIGVTVETFAVGMGPKIFGWERNGTVFKLCAFPIGGYCKMAGETVFDERSGNEGEFLARIGDNPYSGGGQAKRAFISLTTPDWSWLQ